MNEPLSDLDLVRSIGKARGIKIGRIMFELSRDRYSSRPGGLRWENRWLRALNRVRLGLMIADVTVSEDWQGPLEVLVGIDEPGEEKCSTPI